MYPIEEIIAYCFSKVGCGYVWGATGQICTEDFIQYMYNATKSNANSPFHSDATYRDKCRKWIGKQVFDCGGLFDHKLGINISASGYYSNSTVKGKIVGAPRRGALVFKQDSAGHIYHVGIYVGSNQVIEAKGVAYGVVVTVFTGAGWDLWCESTFFEYKEDASVVASNGDKNELVRAIQRGLIALGYNLGAYTDELGKPSGADADYGGTTSTAVAAFKKSKNITGDGNTVDETTFTALLKDVALCAIEDNEKEALEADLAIEKAVNTDLRNQLDILQVNNMELAGYKNDMVTMIEIIKRRAV